MGNWNGEATIKFEVERTEDASGKLIPFSKDTPEDAPYHVVELSVRGRAYYSPGKTWGRPEDCYPEEGEEEILEIFRAKDDGTREDWSEDQLTKSETEFVLSKIWDEIRNNDGPDPDDYFDD